MEKRKEKNNMLYPISEIFVSPQGEGVFAGTMMCFVRLAGCTVGKPYPKEKYAHSRVPPVNLDPLPIYTEKCTLYDGREFPCDTDYRVKERMTPGQILDTIPENVQHVCITGGEPLMHNLSTLLSYLFGAGKKIHIETSGTLVPDWPFKQDVWITVSPKKDVMFAMLERANELKLLIDRNFTSDSLIIASLGQHGVVYIPYRVEEEAKKKPVYIQPVNGEHDVNRENLKLCMELQKKYPQLRLSLQLHKILSAETMELVR